MTTSTTAATTAATTAPAIGRGARITGIVLTVLLTAFFVFDFVPKILSVSFVVDATVAMGFQPHHVPLIGALLLVCTVLYLVPRTSVLGAVLLTAYLGGAVCSQVRIDAPLFSTTLFGVYTGILVWIALYLRSAQLRDIVRRIAAGA